MDAADMALMLMLPPPQTPQNACKRAFMLGILIYARNGSNRNGFDFTVKWHRKTLRAILRVY